MTFEEAEKIWDSAKTPEELEKLFQESGYFDMDRIDIFDLSTLEGRSEYEQETGENK